MTNAEHYLLHALVLIVGGFVGNWWTRRRRPMFVIPEGATLVMPTKCPKCDYNMGVKFE